MNAALEGRIWGYLDRLLPADEVARFERDLLDPAVAEAFGQALMMRELLREVGPDEAPRKLVARLEKAVLSDVAAAGAGEASPGRLRSTLAGLTGLRWAVRGPQSAFAGSVDRTRGALSGIGNTRYSLGPMSGLAGRESERGAAPRRSWWKRALGLGKS